MKEEEVEKYREREEQGRTILGMMKDPLPAFVHANFTFPTNYFKNWKPQALALGDVKPLLDILLRYGITLEYGPPIKEAKIIGLIIGPDWTEVALEWDLE